jgi:hypothetical protein
VPTSWTEPDASAPLPTLDRLVNSVRRIRFVRAAEAPAALLELAQVLRSLVVNGGVILEHFDVEADDVAAWFLSRNNFDTYGLLEQLLKSDAVMRSAPALGTFDPRAASRTFEQTSTLHLDGDLAGALLWGGAYEQFEGPHAEAKRLGLEVCHQMFGDAWEDVRVHQSTASWSPWFHDVAWDHSWVITNMRTQQMTLLCATDTD